MGAQADKQLLIRIQRWKEAYNDDTTGIRRTLEDMIEEYAAFVTVSSIVRLSAKRHREDDVPLNQMLFDLVASGFWSRLLLGVRKLLDKGPISGPIGVNSLRSLLQDVRECHRSLNRRVYVEGLRMARYDLATLDTENTEKLRDARGKPVWGDPALTRSTAAHAAFDFLSKIDREQRSAEDIISEDILDQLEARLTKLDNIGDHVSKHVAHSGNAESRKGHDLENFDIRDAKEALKALTQVAGLVGDWFAGGSGIGLATLIGDRFEGLDKPLVASADLNELEENWRSIDRDVNTWAIRPEDL
jgi:hypothetical protein